MYVCVKRRLASFSFMLITALGLHIAVTGIRTSDHRIKIYFFQRYSGVCISGKDGMVAARGRGWGVEWRLGLTIGTRPTRVQSIEKQFQPTVQRTNTKCKKSK